MKEWTFEICEDWNKIKTKEYQNRWLKLLNFSPTAHVFFHPTLVEAWMNTYFSIRNITPIFIWGRSTVNEVFIPLVLWKKNWRNAFLKTIVPVGYSDYDYQEPIFKSEYINLQAFWDELLTLLQTIYHPDEILLSGIREQMTSNNTNWIKGEVCPYLSLENINNNQDLMAFFKTGLRGDIRRQVRRLSEIGTLHLKEYQDSIEVKSTFDTFMEIHRNKWPNAYKAHQFHENLIHDNLLSKTVHFSSLNINDTPIAWHLGFSFKNIYYYYMPAGDPEYSSFSPVKIHLYYLLNRAIENKYDKYDHLRGEENYKTGWSNGYQLVYKTGWKNPSITSRGKQFILHQFKERILIK